MKKIIALVISIAILVAAFVLLPQQKHEDVIAGPADGTNLKIGTLLDLKTALLSLNPYEEGMITSGTITFKYSNNVATTESSFQGSNYVPDIDEGDLELYQADGNLSDGFNGGTLVGPGGVDVGDGPIAIGPGGIEGVDGPIVIGPGGIEGVDGPAYEIDPDMQEQIKDEYQQEIENEINNSIGNVIDTLSIGLTTNKVDLTLYFNENVMYYQLKGTFATRTGDGDAKKVISYVYDIEIYADMNDIAIPNDDQMLVRFNFFDGYSNKAEISTMISPDKLDTWYEMDDTAFEYVSCLFDTFGAIIPKVAMAEASSFDSYDPYDLNPKYFRDAESSNNSSYEFEIDLRNEEAPSFFYNTHSESNDYLNGRTITIDTKSNYTLSNLENTKIEFDFSDVEIKKVTDFHWNFFAVLFGHNTEEGGAN